MKPASETLRYQNMVANLKTRPFYVKEAALLKEIVGGKQWRMDAVMDAIDASENDWSYSNLRISAMKQAAMFGRLKAMQRICRIFGYDQEKRHGNEEINAAFQYAALHGHYKVADYLADTCRAVSDSVSDYCRVPAIMHAVGGGEYAKIDYLIGKGSNPDYQLGFAVERDDIRMLKHLVSKGANLDYTDRNGSLIARAIHNGNAKTVDYLLSQNVALTDPNLLLNVIYKNDLPLFKKLLDKGAKPHAINLCHVLREDKIGFADAIMAHGASADDAIAELRRQNNGRELEGREKKVFNYLLAHTRQPPFGQKFNYN